MMRIAARPVFHTVMLLLGLAALGMGWGIRCERIRARTCDVKSERGRREIETLTAAGLRDGRETLERYDAERVSLRQTLADRRAVLAGADRLTPLANSAREPETGLDAFFDLAAFAERMRRRAGEAAVDLKPEERFGFSDYAGSGPEQSSVLPVFRQRLQVEYLLERLINARPGAVTGVQRERPHAARDVTAAESVPLRRGAESSADYFEMDPRLSLRGAAGIATSAFRLSFTAETRALREFAKALSDADAPCSIRSVEVELRPSTEMDRSTKRGAFDERPRVVREAARFTVTIEFVDRIASGGATD